MIASNHTPALDKEPKEKRDNDDFYPFLIKLRDVSGRRIQKEQTAEHKIYSDKAEQKRLHDCCKPPLFIIDRDSRYGVDHNDRQHRHRP